MENYNRWFSELETRKEFKQGISENGLKNSNITRKHIIQAFTIHKKKGAKMQKSNPIPDEAEENSESTEQLLARLYDTAYYLQKRGIAEINSVETEDTKNSIVIVLIGVKYDQAEGFVQE